MLIALVCRHSFKNRVKTYAWHTTGGLWKSLVPFCEMRILPGGKVPTAFSMDRGGGAGDPAPHNSAWRPATPRSVLDVGGAAPTTPTSPPEAFALTAAATMLLLSLSPEHPLPFMTADVAILPRSNVCVTLGHVNHCRSTRAASSWR